MLAAWYGLRGSWDDVQEAFRDRMPRYDRAWA